MYIYNTYMDAYGCIWTYIWMYLCMYTWMYMDVPLYTIYLTYAKRVHISIHIHI